jgi:hypothetical protein
MEERSNKTVMCSVLFLDIVEYSKKSVSGQIALKDGFNAMLSNAIRTVPVQDRVILDTGDGAAISFLGDVEDALKAALLLRESLLNEGARMDPTLLVRIGINLGPVRLVKDINGQPNIVGDGINVAQRVMGFANPGQILVSRSYFDAVSRLSQEYAGMFHSEGSRTDKHVREHEVYAIGYPGELAGQQKSGGEDTLGIASSRDAVKKAGGFMRGARDTFQQASVQQRLLYAGVLASALLLLVVIVIKIAYRPVVPEPQAVIEAPATPALTEPAPDVVPEPQTVTEAPVEPDTAQPVAAATAETSQIAEPAVEKEQAVAAKKTKQMRSAQETPIDAAAGQGKAGKQLPRVRTLQETASQESTEVKPVGMASVSIAVTPWGEVYLDGNKQGVSPPLDELQVTPGEHEIEIRNSTFPPHTLSIQLKADEKMKIKHKFTN